MSEFRLPPPVPLEVFFDTDNELTVVVHDPETDAPPEGGVAGWSMRLQLFGADGSLADTKTTSGGEIVTVDDVGIFRMTISPDTDGLAVNTVGEYWLRRTDAGARGVALRGPLIVSSARG